MSCLQLCRRGANAAIRGFVFPSRQNRLVRLKMSGAGAEKFLVNRYFEATLNFQEVYQTQNSPLILEIGNRFIGFLSFLIING